MWSNRPEILDSALLRPGRFDRQVLVDRPDINGWEAISKIHTNNAVLGPEVDLHMIAGRTPGFVGADLANIINEAALLAARNDKETVELADFDEAVDRVVAGLQKKNRVMSPKEKEIVAFHESGHAIVAESVENVDPVHFIRQYADQCLTSSTGEADTHRLLNRALKAAGLYERVREN